MAGQPAADPSGGAAIQERSAHPVRRLQRQLHFGRPQQLFPLHRAGGLPRPAGARPVSDLLPRGSGAVRAGVRRAGAYRPPAGRVRIALLLQTICATGIRVSELSAITVEAAHKGVAVVRCKGKLRRVLLPSRLQSKLLRYARRRRIAYGPVFVTRTGQPLDRSNIWREMKSLCRDAGVESGKVFPHNLRHLFARSFYRLERDLAKLADLLGHSSINTTRIYVRTTSAEHRKYLEQMQLVL